VRDTGIGIPPDKLTEAFELFSQLNRTLDRSQGGLGIGLALVQRLVQMHGGSIDAHSEGSGKGTAFTVRLPAVAAIATAARAGVPEARHPDQAQRILVVDDNHDAADSLSMLLETLGHETRTVHSGFEAVAAAVEFQPSLVFLDIGLPGISGYEVARRLKSDDALATTMIVAVTGWGTEEDRRRAAEAGFDVHLTKPIDIAAVQNVLVRSTSDR
jgi:CheY-like chemotaxis protein